MRGGGAAVRDGVSVIALFYVPASPAPSQDALMAHATANLARYKHPRLFVAVDCLPKNANHKVNRTSLRQTWKG